MPTGTNFLKDSGKPLFFPISNQVDVGILPPKPRIGTSLRVAVRSLSVMQKEALVASSRTGQVWRLASDEGAYLDGYDYAPAPLAFLSVGMVASYMNEIEALAKIRGISIRNIRLIQDNFYTMSGSTLKGTMVGGAENISLEAQIDADVDTDALQSLVNDSVAASPLNGLMRGVKESLFTLTHNDRELEPNKVPKLDTPAFTDPGDKFDIVKIASGDWPDLIVHTGKMSPKYTGTASFGREWLNDDKARPVHLRVLATKRADGVKEIEQHLCSPQGTIFRFLSDENARAPDAESYIAAGIGFCFMTQFGRFAKVVKKDFREYRILQDAHFSLAGASDGTGQSGTAEPLETHCYLFSEQDDEFARKALDMAEQTCFLHAFCKTDLKAKVRIKDFGNPES